MKLKIPSIRESILGMAAITSFITGWLGGNPFFTLIFAAIILLIALNIQKARMLKSDSKYKMLMQFVFTFFDRENEDLVDYVIDMFCKKNVSESPKLIGVTLYIIDRSLYDVWKTTLSTHNNVKQAEFSKAKKVLARSIIKKWKKEYS